MSSVFDSNMNGLLPACEDLVLRPMQPYRLTTSVSVPSAPERTWLCSLPAEARQ